MANTLRIKRRASGTSNGGVPTTSQCVNAELAFNEVNGKLYYGKGGDASASSSVVAIGGENFSFLDGVTAGTAAASKALTLNSSGRVSGFTIAGALDISTVSGTVAAGLSVDVSESNYFSIYHGVAGGNGAVRFSHGVEAGGVNGDIWLISNDDSYVGSSTTYDIRWPNQTGRLATLADINSAVANAVGLSSSLKSPVAAATTANITLSNAQTIDGVALSAGDRVLVKNQTTGTNNGIYVVAAGAWSRAVDTDTGAELLGSSTFVLNGATNGSKTFVNTNTGAITVGTTAVTFADQSSVAAITPGAGLTKTGATIDVVTANAARIVVNPDNIDLATVGTSGTYAKVSTDAYGRVTSGSAQVAIGTDVSGLGTGVATFLGTPNSANLAAALTDETGSSTVVFSNSPTLVTPNIGVATGTSFNSITGLSATLPVVDGTATIGTATTAARADHVHPTDTSRAATSSTLAQFAATTSAQLAGVISDETGSGLLVFATSPVLTTPNIGTPSAGTLTNCTGLPISGIASLGTGVGTFLATPTSANLAAALTDESGSTAVVFSNSPTLVTPTLGAATATSINKVAITAPATSATLVIADGKTLTASNTLTFTGTDSSSVAFGAGGTVPYVDVGKTNTYGSSNTFFISDTATFKLQRPGPFNSLAFALDGNDDDAASVTTIKTSQTNDAITVLLPFEDGRLATQADVNSAIATAIGYSSAAKYPVRVATTANITLSGVQTIDGVAVVAGDRVLVKNQTTGSNNGIYGVATGAWVRVADLDTSAETVTGVSTYVISGTSNGGKSFVLTTTGVITLGTTALTFENLSTAAVVTAGNGLTRTGNVLDVASTGAGSLTVTADSINLTGSIATIGTYRSVTVDTYGRVTAGTAPTTFSGYGISDTSANLAAAITDETGSGLLVFATNPVLTTPNIGTPSAGTLTNCSGLPISGIASLGTGVGTFLATPSSANLAAALTDETGSSAVVFSTSPAFTTSVTTASTTFAVFNTAATTVNAFGAATAINMGASTGTTTINNNLTVSGNLTINGTTTTINANTLTVDDKNIELGHVSAVTGITGTISAVGGSAPNVVVTVTGLSSVAGLIAGMALTQTSGAGAFGSTAIIANIDSATQITVTSTTTGTTGAITFNAAGVSDDTANDGGIILHSTSNKTWKWLKATAAWTSSEDINLVSTKVYEINGATVLSATTLGSGVTGSSLTSVGTIGTGTWQGTAVAVAYGGTGAANASGARTNLGLVIGTDVQAYNATLAAVAGGTYSGDDSITTVGTVSAGTWQGTAVGPVYGGTGQTSYATGDLLYASAANTLSKLTKPASTTSILQMTSAGVPSWVDPCTAVANCTLDGGTF